MKGVVVTEVGLCLLLLWCGASRGRVGLRIYLSSWAIRVPGGVLEVQRLARKHGLLYLGQVIEGGNYYHLEHRGVKQQSLNPHWGWHVRLKKEPKVHWFEQQILKRRSRRTIAVVPTDPWFQEQWYMVSGLWDNWAMSKGQHVWNNDVTPDLNVLAAWSRGYTGLGVVVSILDDGIEKDHPDLVDNYDPLASYDFNDNDPDPQPHYNAWNENRHGTRCAGEVAAAANNGICGAGIAHRANIGGIRMLDGPVTDIVEAQSLSFHPQHISIYSASWGPEDDGKTVDGPGILALEAFYNGIINGRGGLGSLFVWASGNGGYRYDNCNCDGYTNSIYTLSVGSTTESGHIPWYNEACASTLTTTYSSGAKGEKQIVTTDLRHKCTSEHTGTSASAPLAAGMIALALEANPGLTWRDMQHLVVRASKPAHLQAGDWAVNGVGRKVSHYYGYGLLDAGELVDLARKWTPTRPQQNCSVNVIYKPLAFSSRLSISANASTCHGKKSAILSLEHVQVQLSLSYSRRGDLTILLTSPMGTKSTLVAVRPYDTSSDGYDDWSFMSTHYWDEDPRGTWTLLLENKGDAYNSGKLATFLNSGFLTKFVLKLYGTDEDMSARRAAAVVVSECVRRDVNGTCQECTSPFYTFQHLCLTYCPPRYYNHTHHSLDSSGTVRTVRVCAACHFSCYTCQGGMANNCTACPPFSAYDKLTHTCSQPFFSYLPHGGNLILGPQRLLLLIAVILLCVGPILIGIPWLVYRWLSRGGLWQKKPDPAPESQAASLELIRCNYIGSEEQPKELGQRLLP